MSFKKLSFYTRPDQQKELEVLNKRFNLSKLLREALDIVIKKVKEGV